jgi:hypothetical protein
VADGQFELVVDGEPTTLHFAGGRLRQEPGAAPDPELTVRTTTAFLDQWAAGDTDWDSARATGDVTVDGPEPAWPRWLAATGYLLTVLPETDAEAADA